MPRIPTPHLRTTSPTDSDSSETMSSTHSNMTIGAAGVSPEILSIPIEMTMTGQSSQSETERYSDPNERPPGTSGGRISRGGSMLPIGESENPWATSSLPPKEIPSMAQSYNKGIPSWPESSTIETGSIFPQRQGIKYATSGSAPPQNKGNWRTCSVTSPHGRTTSYGTEKQTPDFEGFVYDYPAGFKPSQMPEDIPDFHMFRIDPFPDSPPRCVTQQWRRRGEYHGRGTSRLIGGANEGMGESSQPTDADRMNQLEAQMVQMRDENVRLREELAEAKRQGKQPERGRQPRPGPLTDQFLVM